MWLFILFISVIYASVCTRERILNCAMTYVDSNHDGYITVSEINNFIITKPCGPSSTYIHAPSIMEKCDANVDGMLDETDYDAPNSCMRIDSLRELVCMKCDECEL